MTPSSSPSSAKLNIVVDTNLFLSVFVFRGMMMRSVFELVIDKKINLYASPSLLSELKKKFDFFSVNQQVQNEVLFFVNMSGIIIDPYIIIEESRDIKDNFLLELSETANADYLVTRDNDLLVLKKWKDTVIITPEDFLPFLRKNKILK